MVECPCKRSSALARYTVVAMLSESEAAEAQRERALQTWGLEVFDSASPEVIAVLRKILRVKRSELAAFSAKLPGTVRRGARVDLEPFAAQLVEAGIRCEVLRAPGPSQGE